MKKVVAGGTKRIVKVPIMRGSFRLPAAANQRRPITGQGRIDGSRAGLGAVRGVS